MSVGFKYILGCYKDSASLEIDMYIWKWNDRWISESKSIHIFPLYVAIRSWLQTSYRIARATYFFMYLLCWMQTYDNQISLKKYYYLLVGDQFFLHFSIQSHSRYYIRRLSHIPFPTLTRERRCSFFKWVLRKIILSPWSICRRKIVWIKSCTLNLRNNVSILGFFKILCLNWMKGCQLIAHTLTVKDVCENCERGKM